MSEHYHLIRTDPNYRLAIQLEEMRAEMQPPLGDKVLLDPIPSPICPEWSRRQWDAVNQLRGLTLHLQKTVNEIKQKSTPKEKEGYLIKE